MGQRSKLLIVLAANAAIAVLILRNVESHAPIQRGTAAEFWLEICGVDISGEHKQSNYIGDTYPPQGDWAIYYIQGYHGQFRYRVPLAELVPDLPQVEDELRRDVDHGESTPWRVHLMLNWTQTTSDEEEVRRLLAVMRDATLAVFFEQFANWPLVFGHQVMYTYEHLTLLTRLPSIPCRARLC